MKMLVQHRKQQTIWSPLGSQTRKEPHSIVVVLLVRLPNLLSNSSRWCFQVSQPSNFSWIPDDRIKQPNSQTKCDEPVQSANFGLNNLSSRMSLLLLLWLCPAPYLLGCRGVEWRCTYSSSSSVDFLIKALSAAAWHLFLPLEIENVPLPPYILISWSSFRLFRLP